MTLTDTRLISQGGRAVENMGGFRRGTREGRVGRGLSRSGGAQCAWTNQNDTLEQNLDTFGHVVFWTPTLPPRLITSLVPYRTAGYEPRLGGGHRWFISRALCHGSSGLLFSADAQLIILERDASRENRTGTFQAALHWEEEAMQ